MRALSRWLGALLLWCVAASAVAQGAALGPVGQEYFGLVLNRSDGRQAWPAVPFGSWRIWDSYATWPYLEPERGRWDFAALDRMVQEAQDHGVRVLLVLAHSPKWASARPTERSGYGAGFAAEPARIDDWQRYVKTVAERYKGRITEYEIWNEPSDKIHFSGDLPKMVELTCTAYRTLKAIDPAVKVVSPGSAGGGRHIQYLDDFLAAGGATCIDVVAHHFYVPRYGPEEMVPLIRKVRAVMQRRGVAALPLWNTETGWWIANTDGTPDHALVAKGGWRKLDADVEAGAAIQRALLLARAEGVERFYWYAWSNRYGLGLADANDKPKPATRYWARVVEQMLGKQVRACSLDGAAGRCDLAQAGRPASTLHWRDPAALVRREGAATTAALPDSLPH